MLEITSSEDDGGDEYSGGGDREPTELKSELNSDSSGLFMIEDSARAQKGSRLVA